MIYLQLLRGGTLGRPYLLIHIKRSVDGVVQIMVFGYQSVISLCTLVMQVKLMCSYCTKHNETEVPDPYYGGPQGFEKVEFQYLMTLLYLILR